MTKSEVLTKVRVLLGLEKFDEATLADGTKITNKMDEDFAPGQMLYVIDAEGNEVPAPEGEHVTESGITLVVDAEGNITGVREPDMEGEGSLEAAEHEDKKEMEVEEKMEVSEEAIAEVAEEVVEAGLSPEDLIEMIAPVVEEIAAVKEEIAAMKKEFEEYINGPAKENMKKDFSKFKKSETDVIDAYTRLASIRREFSKK